MKFDKANLEIWGAAYSIDLLVTVVSGTTAEIEKGAKLAEHPNYDLPKATL